ncbi:hypothetical protein KKB55_08520 [Myxococcota bacterium]|nr:hypothetical protein [Myxococcota bacterium]
MRSWTLLFCAALWACDDGGDDPAPAPAPDAAPVDVFIPPVEDATPPVEDAAPPDAYVPDAALDVDGPRITFDRPGDSERVEGEVRVELKVRDATGVARVTLSVEGEEVAAFEAAPYEWSWDTRELVEGPYKLKAMAWDTVGNASELEITVNVRSACGDDCPPRGLEFLSPLDGATLCGAQQIEVEASDDVGVAAVALLVDGEELARFEAPPYRQAWDTTTVEDGPHELRMIATDTSSQRAERAINVTVANAAECDNPPSVEFIEPLEGAYVSGIVPISVLARDDNEIKSVIFFLDGQRHIEDATGPYGFDLYTADLSAGAHTIMARAEDRADQQAAVERVVIVDQVDPSLAMLRPVEGEVFEGDVRLEAEVDDDNGVARVRFLIEATEIIEGEAAPATLRDESLDAPPWVLTVPEAELPNAPLQARVIATDIAGRVVEVGPTPFTADPAPTLRFTAPAANARIEGAVEVRVEALDDQGFAEITFSVDGEALGPFIDGRFSWTPQYWMGERSLRAEGVTLSGQTATATLTVVVDHPLVVTLDHCLMTPSEEEGGEPIRACAPMARDATLRDAVEVEVGTEDDDGVIEAISLLMDGEIFLSRDAAALAAEGRAFTFDAWAFEDGRRTLAAEAVNDNGATTRLEIPVRINNCDRDGDGHDDDSRACGGQDCDDAEASVKPGAAEGCDGVDNDCDGLIDEGCGAAPTISSVAFYVSEGILGLEVEGNDPDGDVNHVSIELFDENGGAIPMREGVEGATRLALDAVEALDEEGGFRGVWSGVGPAASNALVAVGDASGALSDPRVSIARAPRAAALGEACDLYGGVAACPDGAVCEGWICVEASAPTACPTLSALVEADDGGWIVLGDTLDAGDDSRGSCGGGWAEDQAFTFTAPAAGLYAVTVEVVEGDEGDAPRLYARNRCDLEDGAFELACGAALELSLEADALIYLYVDGAPGWSGRYTLRVTPL